MGKAKGGSGRRKEKNFDVAWGFLFFEFLEDRIPGFTETGIPFRRFSVGPPKQKSQQDRGRRSFVRSEVFLASIGGA
jgi:hypothetical protein